MNLRHLTVADMCLSVTVTVAVAVAAGVAHARYAPARHALVGCGSACLCLGTSRLGAGAPLAAWAMLRLIIVYPFRPSLLLLRLLLPRPCLCRPVLKASLVDRSHSRSHQSLVRLHSPGGANPLARPTLSAFVQPPAALPLPPAPPLPS